MPDGSARVRKFVFLVAVLMAYPVLGIAGPSSARLAAMDSLWVAYTFLYQGAPAAGTLLIGAIAEHTGLAWPVAAAGMLGIAFWLVMLPRLGGMIAALEGAARAAPQAGRSP